MDNQISYKKLAKKFRTGEKCLACHKEVSDAQYCGEVPLKMGDIGFYCCSEKCRKEFLDALAEQMVSCDCPDTDRTRH